MLVIRLLRTGKKNQPFFRIVVTDKRKSAKAGRFVEKVGFWNPLTKERKINGERIKYWLLKGAQASDTVHNFLIDEKIIEGKKIAKHKKAKKKKVAEEKVEAVKPGGEIQEEPKKEIKPEIVEEKKKDIQEKSKEAKVREKKENKPEAEEKPGETKKEAKEEKKEEAKESKKETVKEN